MPLTVLDLPLCFWSNSNMDDLRRGRNCIFILHVHLVFVTKYRRCALNSAHLDYLKECFTKVAGDFGATLTEFNGEADHVHLLLNYPPTVSVSKLVNSLKGASSRKLKNTFPDLLRFFYKGALWSPSYFAGSCGGAPISILRQYIENQNSPL